jgi:outer membrane lipoprotein-sorting protein
MNSRYFSGLAAIALLCCVPGDLLRPKSALAQESSASAESLTRLLEEHYRRPRTLRGVFLERYSEGQRQVRVESGTVYFQRPGQMRWEYDSPEPKLFLVDGKTTWFYVPYDHTVTKVPVRESSDWRTPFMLLMGKTDLARLCSRVELISQRGIPSGHAVLRCLPREAKEPRPAANSRSPQPEFTPGKAPTDVLLEIDASTGELARIEIREQGGIDLEYRFGNWQTDVSLPKELFHFQVPAGVAIVDGESLAGESN